MTKWIGPLAIAAIGLSLVTEPAAAAENAVPNTPEAQAEAQKLAKEPPVAPPKGNKVVNDHSGRKQKGKASYYGPEFNGKKMANGKPFNPNSNAAASKSLPLGTTAKVTNLNNGKSAEVKVDDRGPYVDGRVVDVSPKAAEQLGMTEHGVAPVVVAPITVPQPDGGVKAGAGAAEPTEAKR